MKLYDTISIFFPFGLFIAEYLICSFLYWNFDGKEWGFTTRATLIVYTIAVLLLYYACYLAHQIRYESKQAEIKTRQNTLI